MCLGCAQLISWFITIQSCLSFLHRYSELGILAQLDLLSSFNEVLQSEITQRKFTPPRQY